MFPGLDLRHHGAKMRGRVARKIPNQNVADALAKDVQPEPPSPDADTKLDLAEAMRRLPREQAVAIALLYGEEMSVAEIAAITSVPPGTVKSRLSAARQALRQLMEGENDEQT